MDQNKNDNDDPFSAFDDDDDSNNDDNEEITTLRDPSCGPHAFHEGTEQALLHYLQNHFQQQQPAAAGDNETKLKRLETIVTLVDQFCFTRHWMMHVGNVKGPIVDDFLSQCYVSKQQQQQQSPFILVEIGTYCGYSLTRMARTIISLSKSNGKKQQESLPFHIFTVDINPNNVAVAKEIVKLAGLEDQVTFLLLKGGDNAEQNSETELFDMVESAISDRYGTEGEVGGGIDFLFIDHDKNAYLRDLLRLEQPPQQHNQQKRQSLLIRANTYVCADNIFHFHLDEYRQHMAELAAAGVVTTRLEMSQLEYVTKEEEASEDLRDGLELTIYLKDPPLLRVAGNE